MGRLEGKQALERVEAAREEEKLKLQEKEEKLQTKQLQEQAFLKCQEKCVCSDVKCNAFGLKMWSTCKRMLKNQCQQKACCLEGVKPAMLLPACNRKILKVTEVYSSEESEEDSDDVGTRTSSGDSDSDSDMTTVKCLSAPTKQPPRPKRRKILPLQDQIENVMESLDDDKVGMFYCIYFDEGRYWRRLDKVFSDDPESPTQVEINFLEYKSEGYWDFPKTKEILLLESKFVFYGPLKPNVPTKQGYRIPDDADALVRYKQIMFLVSYSTCIIMNFCF